MSSLDEYVTLNLTEYLPSNVAFVAVAGRDRIQVSYILG